MWFKKREAPDRKADHLAEDPVVALHKRYSGPHYGESIETATVAKLRVDGIRTPPVELHAELLREAGDLVKAGTTDAAPLLDADVSTFRVSTRTGQLQLQLQACLLSCPECLSEGVKHLVLGRSWVGCRG